MDHFKLATSVYEEWLPGPNVLHTSFNIIFVVGLIGTLYAISTIVLKSFGWIVAFFKPLDYKLDMTTKEYCKYIAEVDNRLKLQRQQATDDDLKQKLETATSGLNELLADSTTVNQSQSNQLVDCTTDLLNNNDARDFIQKMQMIVTPSDKNNINNNDYLHDVPSSSQNNDRTTKNDDNDLDGTEHVYPNGWLPLLESSKVKAGSIKKAIIMGRDVIITRSIEGEVSVLDAYCPHMGVHIGVGGRVLRVNNQSCVQCPFHGWTFRASDGQCVRIPYMKNQCSSSTNKLNTIPKQAKLATWQSVEVDNFIYIWHHIDNEPPNWFLTPTEELTNMKNSNWVLVGRSCHKTNLEIRDVLENGADMNHFEGIHNDLFVFGGEFLKVQAFSHLQNYFRHHWSPDWKPILNEDGKMSHRAEMDLLSWITIFKMRAFDVHVHAVQIGPAYVSLRYDSRWYGKGIIKMNAIPLGGRRTLYVQHIYTENTLYNWFMAKWVMYGEIMQLERDLFIWNHKKNIVNPIFVPEDRILKRFRMWYSQFYRRKRRITIKDEQYNHPHHHMNDNRELSSEDLNF